MRVLVTGGSGLVGKYVVGELSRVHQVEVLDIQSPQLKTIRWHRVDLLDFDQVLASVRGFDAIVHLGGIPHPLNDPPEKVFRVNVMGTFHILEACARASISTLVFMSSESTLGFAFATGAIAPQFFPIDETHPLRPQDPYGLSKVVGEQICASYSLKASMRTTCLRAPWIWVPEGKERATYRQLVSEYPKWHKNMWAFIHVLDVAHAISRSLEYRGSSTHDIFFITADENWTGKESGKLAEQFFPGVPFPRDLGKKSLISNRKAKELLGFSPRYTAHDLVRSDI